MQLLQEASIAGMPAASAVMDTVPHLLRFLRDNRRSSHLGLSFSQVGVLSYLSRHAGASLSALTEYLGLTAPSASRQVDYLVRHGLVRREAGDSDRRLVRLALTEAGAEMLAAARQEAEANLQAKFAGVSPGEQQKIERAMRRLQHLLEPAKGPGPAL